MPKTTLVPRAGPGSVQAQAPSSESTSDVTFLATVSHRVPASHVLTLPQDASRPLEAAVREMPPQGRFPLNT